MIVVRLFPYLPKFSLPDNVAVSLKKINIIFYTKIPNLSQTISMQNVVACYFSLNYSS